MAYQCTCTAMSRRSSLSAGSASERSVLLDSTVQLTMIDRPQSFRVKSRLTLDRAARRSHFIFT